MSEESRQNTDEVLIIELARGASQRAAAITAGVSERTVRRRLDEPDFRRKVRELRAEITEQTVGLLADASGEAVETLRGLLKCDSDQVRLGAAKSIIELAQKLREQTELADRLAEIEEHLQNVN